MPFTNRVDRRIWWLTMSKAADRSSKISIEDLESALASLRASTTESKAVSVECPFLKPDCLLSRRLFWRVFCSREGESERRLRRKMTWRGMCCVRNNVEVKSEGEVIRGVQWSNQHLISGAVSRVNKVQLVA